MTEPALVDDYGYCTIEEIVTVWHVKLSYAYRLAHKHQWGRYRHPDGTTRYRRQHVEDTLSSGVDRRKSRPKVKSGLECGAV